MKWFHDFTKELKNSEFPVMLYGAGIYAQRLTELLEADGVSVEGYLVDRKYYSESSSLLGKNVYLLESFVAENECTIVIAFEECSIERENELRGMANVRQIYSKDFGRDVATFIKNFWKSGDEFYEKEKTVLEKLRDDLCDEVSKVHFDEYIKQRLTGCGRKVHSMNPEYFDSDIIEAIRMTEAETFVDCGAFDGDTVLGFVNFLKRCGRSAYNKIYAFEIDPANIKQMCKNLNGLNNVELIEKGVTDHTGTLCFRSGGGGGGDPNRPNF